jgi:hypothetical protein
MIRHCGVECARGIGPASFGPKKNNNSSFAADIRSRGSPFLFRLETTKKKKKSKRKRNWLWRAGTNERVRKSVLKGSASESPGHGQCR